MGTHSPAPVGGLKILVSAVGFRPWPLFHLFLILLVYSSLTSGGTKRISTADQARSEGASMQWEYKLVALGLLVDATEPHQPEKHEEILNGLGREGWEAVAYAAQSDTVLLKRPVKHGPDRKTVRQRR